MTIANNVGVQFKIARRFGIFSTQIIKKIYSDWIIIHYILTSKYHIYFLYNYYVSIKIFKNFKLNVSFSDIDFFNE